MNQQKFTAIQTKTLNEGPIDQSKISLRNIWEKIQINEKDRNEETITDSIINLIKNAEEIIVIYSPKITLPELKIELEKSRKKGIRIYAITANIQNHQNLFECGMMRYKNNIHSTYILVDPKTKPDGKWFPGELTSKTMPPLIITLNENQIREFLEHFSHEFWNNDGQELFFNKIRKIPPLEDRKPTTPTIMNATSRDDFSYFQGSEIKEMQLPSNKPPEFNHHISARKIVTQLNEKTRDMIEEIDHSWTNLYGIKKDTFGYAKLETGDRTDKVVFSWDYAIILDSDQVKEIEKSLPEEEWRFCPEKAINEIKSDIIEENDNWENLVPKSIQEKGKMELEKQQSMTIEDWIKDLPRPKIPDYGGLFKEVTYSWKLSPPIFPVGAQKHRLYSLWDRFERELQSQIDKEIQKMKKAIEQSKKLKIENIKIITMESKITGLIEEIDKMKSLEWRYMPDTGDVKRGIEKIHELEEQFLIEIEKKVSETKKEEKSNELHEVLNLGSTKQKEPDIPPKTLPKIGILFEKGNEIYLQIEYHEEISIAQKKAPIYHAKIVVKGE